MLADILTYQERNASGAGHVVDADALRNSLDMLHKDDKALERYFGLGKDDLLKWFEQADKQSAPKVQHPAALELGRKIRVIESSTETGCSNELHETFSGFYRPLISYFENVFKCDKRYEGAHAYINVETLISSVRPYVVNSIKRLSEKSLVHFLNTRIADGVESDLQSFEQYLCTESPGTFLESYPVLADLLFRQLEGTAAYLYKIILHFTDDIDELARVFDMPDRRIHSLELGLGDPHADGETVCAVRVGSLSLVYKPRSNREAQLYGSLLRLFYQLTADEVFSVHSPLLVCRDDHCWIEKIDNRACDNAADIALFYRRTGAQIALVHALNGIDFHYENIIACGSSPVLIDLECLFTASMIDLQRDLPRGSAMFKALKSNGQSVFASGFVPYAPDSQNDFSGLTAQKQFTSTTRQLIREQGFYHLKRVPVDKTPVLKHLPIYEGVQHSLASHQQAFLQGFEFAYDEVNKHQQAMLELIGQHSTRLKTRVLIKNTQRYIDFIELTLHPRFTQCMLQRQLLLATLWSEAKESLVDTNLASHELADLQSANIPSFTLPIAANQVFDSRGTYVATLEIESPLQSCQRKLSAFSARDKAFQTSILKACLFPLGNLAMPMNRRHASTGNPGMQSAQYLAVVLRIAGVIEHWRIDGDEGDVAWSFLNSHPATGRHYLSPMTNSLYSGMGGLAIFYISLYRASGRAEHLVQAERIVDSMARSHEHFDSDTAVSAYFGLASYLYVLVNHQQVTGRDTHRSTIDELLRKLSDFPRLGDEFDFLNGWCGTLTLLVNLYELQPQESLVPLIDKFATALRAELLNQDGRFVCKSSGVPLLTGFSHGVSGVLHALAKVYQLTKDATLIALITDLLEDENRQKAEGFWLDLREPSKPGHMSKWCHGDAGILISRLQLQLALKGEMSAEHSAMVEEDIRTCESNLWRHGLGSGYGLCHGDFGNLLCLLALYRRTENREGAARTLQAMSEAAENFLDQDFMSEDNVPVLGMMLGIAGVGQALLTAIDPALPDVLALTFMRQHSAGAVQDRPSTG